MHITANDILFVRNRKGADGKLAEYVQPGEIVEVDDIRAQILINNGQAKAATKADVTRAAKDADAVKAAQEKAAAAAETQAATAAAQEADVVAALKEGASQ